MSKLIKSLLLVVVLLGLAAPARAQSVSRDRLDGSVLVNGVKPPVIAATTVPITLSGQQTIDGVALTQNQRVLVKNQANATTNGIYVVSLGTWSRSQDFDGPGDVMGGVLIPVFQGTQAGLWQLTTTDTIIIGTSSLSFTSFSTGSGASVANAVNVTQSPYGAKCDGVTNDNTAFTSALATGKCVYVPPSSLGCALNNLTVPSNSCILGISAPQYATMLTASRVVPASGATTVLNVSGASNIAFSGFDIFCGGTLASPTYGSTKTGISSGSTGLYLSEMGVHYCGNGGIGDVSVPTTAMVSQGSTYFGNGQANTTAALVNIVDSRSTNDTIASNYNGSYLGTGANDNSFSNDKIEWSTNFGIVCFQCKHTAVTGGVSDSNANGGIEFAQATAFSVSGGVYRRNGSTNTYGNNSDFYFNGGSPGVSITGISTDHGKNDDNTGTDRPAYIAFFNANTDTNVNIQGNDFSGYVTAPVGYNATTFGSGILSHNIGATPKYVGTDATGTAYSAAELTALGAGAGGSGTVNAGTAGNMAYYATSTTAVSPATRANISNGQLTLGTASSVAGSLILEGSTSGAATISVPAAAGTPTFQLPTTNGSNGQALTTDGSGHTSWQSSGSGALVLLSTVNASNVATINFDSSLITNTYNKYEVDCDTFLPVTNGASLQLLVSPDNGATIEASNYQWTVAGRNVGGAISSGNSSDSAIQMTMTRGLYNTSHLTDVFHIDFAKPSGTDITVFNWYGGFWDQTGAGNYMANYSGTGSWATAGAINYVRLRLSSGNISTANCHLYGRVGI